MGFLNTKDIDSVQADLGIEVILKLFSKVGLSNLFKIATVDEAVSDNSNEFCITRRVYQND
jgi:hypothetical protein